MSRPRARSGLQLTAGAIAALGYAALAGACSGSVVGGDDGTGGGSSGASNAYVYPSRPGMLTFRLSSFGASCADPSIEAPVERCDWTDITVEVPADDWAAGTTYDASSVQIVAGAAVMDPAGADGSCGFSFLGGLFAKFTIDSVSDASTTVTLEGWDDLFVGQHFDGTYDAVHCMGVAP